MLSKRTQGRSAAIGMQHLYGRPPLATDSIRLLVLSRYGPMGSSSRLRILQYFPYLTAAGFDLLPCPFFSQAYLLGLYEHNRRSAWDIVIAYLRRIRALVSAHRCSLVWVEKELFPYLPAWFEGFLHRWRIPYVLDYDDAVFHRFDLHPSKLVRRLLGNKFASLIRSARLVTPGNRYLADYCADRGARDIRILPTVLDIDRYNVQAEPVLSSTTEVRIGWIGSPTTATYLELVRQPLQALARERPLRLVVIGARNIPGIDVPIEFHPWSSDTEAALLGTLHVGIMPLSDGPWERGKCGYKLIQYMACGKPVVASPVGVNTDIATPDVGYLAADDRDWLEAFRSLSADTALRHRLGLAGRASVEASYSLQVSAPRLRDMLAQAALQDP
jgi:glycosyltransferase involved in cell wall biosynthesis